MIERDGTDRCEADSAGIAVARGLGPEKRFKNTLLQAFGNAGPVVDLDRAGLTEP
jgi:hypothetical protein